MKFRVRLRHILAIGLGIRLLVMPFFAHPDLLLTYGRSWQIAFSGAGLFQFSQPIPHILQAFWLQFWSIFTGSQFFQPLIVTRPVTYPNYAMMTDFVTLNSAPQLNLFLFKLLYLLIDLAVVYLLWRWFVQPLMQKASSAAKGKLLLALYWLNPLLIFAVYIFGRYEVIPALFLLLTIWLIKENKLLLSAVSLGLLIVARSSFVILIPIFLILYGKRWWEKALMGIITVIPYGITQLLRPAGFSVQSATAVANSSHAEYLTAGGVLIEDVFQLKLSFFVILYAVLAYIAWLVYQKAQVTWQHSALFFTLTLVIYFATSFYHPHYLAWIVVPLAITVVEFKLWQQLKWLLLAVVLLLPPLLLTWGRDMWMGLFIPLNTELGNKDLQGVIANFIDPVQFNSIDRKSVV